MRELSERYHLSTIRYSGLGRTNQKIDMIGTDALAVKNVLQVWGFSPNEIHDLFCDDTIVQDRQEFVLSRTMR